MSIHLWSLFFLAYLATTLSPGPNVLLVIRNTLRYGRQGTFVTVLGNLLAQLGVIVLVACGIGTLLKTLPPLFVAMKLAGAAYLLWIGARQLLGNAAPAAKSETQEGGAPCRRSRVFREALLVSGSNPKTMIFLSAFLPQFLVTNRPLWTQFAIMYLTIAATVLLVHSIYATSAGLMQTRLHNGSLRNGLRRAGGALFIGLGIKLARLQVT